MKNTLIGAAAAALVLISQPTLAQEAVPAAPATAPAAPAPTPKAAPTAVPAYVAKSPDQILNDLQKSPLWQMYSGVIADLSPLLDQDVNLKSRLDKLGEFQFSPETKKKLVEVFGNDNPLHLKTTTLPKGEVEVSVTLDSLDYHDQKNDLTAHSSALSGKATFNRQATKVHAAVSMPSFTFGGAKMQLSATGMRISSDQVRGLYGLWLGTGLAELDHMTIESGSAEKQIKIDGISVNSETRQHDNLLDVGVDYLIKSFSWGDDEVDQLHIDAKVINMDEKQLAAITKKANKLNESKPTIEEQLAAGKEIWKSIGLAMTHGGAVEIKDVSAQYHGMTAGLNGRIAFNIRKASDFASAKALGDRMVAKINVHVPMALVNEVSVVAARKILQQQSKDGKPVDEQVVDVMAKGMVAKGLETLNQKKWIRVENDVILSTIEYSKEKLIINGQNVPFSGIK